MLKVIDKPTVRIVGSTQINPVEVCYFLDGEVEPKLGFGSLPEDLVEFAGKLCYMSFGKGRTGQEYTDHILESGHGSVLEHVSVSLLFTGVSRSLTHELVRHRAGFAYSQLSQRYVDESDVAFVRPPEIQDGSGADAVWRGLCEEALKGYRQLGDWILIPTEVQGTERRKRVRQAARAVLPNCTETKIVVTANLRAWRHFLELRGSEFADLEIRRLAVAVLEALKGYAPRTFGDFSVEGHPSGIPVLRNCWRKV